MSDTPPKHNPNRSIGAVILMVHKAMPALSCGLPRTGDLIPMKTTPRALAKEVEAVLPLPDVPHERFSGYAIMGLPFASGHILAMRRFTGSSVGPGYSSVWHRDPSGAWRFHSNVPPRQACTRYLGENSTETHVSEILLDWPGEHRLVVRVPAIALEWEVEFTTTAASGFMNAVASALPRSAWRNPAVLAAMGAVAGPLLGIGAIGLQGTTPNGQHFVANPRVIWLAERSRAVLAGQDFGPPGPVRPQARLRDVWIPQRGVLAVGEAYFDPFDATHHSARTCRG
jgi:hypothetical protein